MNPPDIEDVGVDQGGKGETPVLRSTGGVQAEYKGVRVEYSGVQRSTAENSGVSVEYKWSAAEYSGVQVEYSGVQWSTSGVRGVRWSTGVLESRLFPLGVDIK